MQTQTRAEAAAARAMKTQAAAAAAQSLHDWLSIPVEDKLREVRTARLSADRQSRKARADLRKERKQAAILAARRIVAEYGLTKAAIFGRTLRARTPRVVVPAPPVFRDPLTGKTWHGRGRPPAWIVGRDRMEFVIV